MNHKGYVYKVLKEQPIDDHVSELVSLFAAENGPWALPYNPIRGNVIRPKAGGLFVFTNQSAAVKFMRRNTGIYRLWLMLGYGEGVSTIHACPADGAIHYYQEFWDNFKWGNSLATRFRNARCIPAWKLAAPPSGTSVTRGIEVVKMMYFQPVPDTVLYEPTLADLDRIGWMTEIYKRR